MPSCLLDDMDDAQRARGPVATPVFPIRFRCNSRQAMPRRWGSGVGCLLHCCGLGRSITVPPPKFSFDHVVFSFLVLPRRQESRNAESDVITPESDV